jgi:hypothetical protein
MRLLFLAALAASSAVAHAQSVAMLNMALYNDRANVKESTDSVKAVIATEKLRDTLARFPTIQLVDSARVAAAEASPPALSAAAGKPCNLIWLFSGELINVATGELILDDDCELKGDPETMVPAGVGLFANRINKRVMVTAGT